MKFKHRTSIEVPYIRQGLIYFCCQNRINDGYVHELCRKVGGAEYEAAIFKAVTTRDSITAVSMEYYLSESTLVRLINQFYRQFNFEEFIKK